MVKEVQRHHFVSVADLSRQFGVSQPSVRRDLGHLEEMGLLQRVHGGAQALSQPGQIARFNARLLQNVPVKQAIGKAACDLIQPGDIVLLDSGSTVLEIARNLPKCLDNEGRLTVITRSLAIASELRHQRQLRLVLLGGLYAHDFDTLVGPQVEQMLQSMHVDVLFTGADGITAGSGLTTDNLSEADLHRIMAQRADRVVVVIDSSKIGVKHLQTILPLGAIHSLVTDAGAPEAFLAAAQTRGIQVIVVPEPEIQRL